jgi:hypothetical protein
LLNGRRLKNKNGHLYKSEHIQYCKFKNTSTLAIFSSKREKNSGTFSSGSRFLTVAGWRKMKVLPSGLTYKIKETSMIRALITSTFIGALATVPLAANAANADAGASNGAAVGTTTDVKPKVGMDATKTAPADATTAPATDMSGTVATDTMVASNVIGADVKDGTGESIGEIGDLVLSGKGQIQAYVIDVGGFLGMGEKPVALQPTDVMIAADADGALQIKTAMTKEQLKALPDYKAPSEKEVKG